MLTALIIKAMQNIIFKSELQNIIRNEKQEQVCTYIEDHLRDLFSSPYIYDYYLIIKEAGLYQVEQLSTRLIIAWLAYFSADNAVLNSIIEAINPAELTNPHEISLFHSIIAMWNFSLSGDDRIEHANLAIEILTGEEDSVYYANAKLTYAKILSALSYYQQAAKVFQESYQMFNALGMTFPAILSIRNCLLEKYKLGEFQYVMDFSKQLLFRASTFKGKAQFYWSMIYFPMALCCFEMNKLHLAITYMVRAKEYIDSVDLFYLHGNVEIYLYLMYVLTRNVSEMEKIIRQLTDNFGELHHIAVDLTLCMARIILQEFKPELEIRADVERVEFEYMKPYISDELILIISMSYLKIRGLSDSIKVTDIEVVLARLNKVGYIPMVQVLSIILTELYIREGKTDKAFAHLKKAIDIYYKYKICISFYQLSGKTFQMIQQLDEELYRELYKSRASDWKDCNEIISIFSDREKEILQLIAMGKNNDEIGKLLFIGTGTVKWHINHIFSKLNVKNRINAVQKAREIGEIS